VDVFLSFCPIVWQHFARHCRQFRSADFYAPITWISLSLFPLSHNGSPQKGQVYVHIYLLTYYTILLSLILSKDAMTVKYGVIMVLIMPTLTRSVLHILYLSSCSLIHVHAHLIPTYVCRYMITWHMYADTWLNDKYFKRYF
jgi:hypothetical protein